MELCMAHHVPPDDLPAFPNAKKAKPKASRSGGGKRTRWKDADCIYEWDSMHGTVEVYDCRGKHIGEYDIVDGRRLKPADKSRKVEP